MESTSHTEQQSILPLVGLDIYRSWVQTLRKLVPRSRSHRMTTVIASMLYYASLQKSEGQGREILDRIQKTRELDAIGSADGIATLRPLIEKLYEDAGLSCCDRRTRDGRAYSPIDGAIREFLAWENHAWE